MNDQEVVLIHNFSLEYVLTNMETLIGSRRNGRVVKRIDSFQIIEDKDVVGMWVAVVVVRFFD